MQPAFWNHAPDPMPYAGIAWHEHGVEALDPQQHYRLLRHDPRRYADMVRSVTAFGIHLIDREGRIRSWNQGAANITGLVEADVVGRPHTVLFAEAQQQQGMPQRMLEFVRTHGHRREEQPRRRRDGGVFLAQCTLDAVRAASGELLGFVEVFQDVTEQRQREDTLHHRATRDALTGIFNRGHFVDLATQEIERAQRFAEPLSVLLLDIDRFKRINDSYGHEVGDRIIINLSRMAQASCRKLDICGRLGGEEFAILLPRANKEPALEFAQRLRLRIAEQRVAITGGREIAYTASLGVASLRSTVRDLPELLRNADAALYSAKRGGRNRVEAWFE